MSHASRYTHEGWRSHTEKRTGHVTADPSAGQRCPRSTGQATSPRGPVPNASGAGSPHRINARLDGAGNIPGGGVLNCRGGGVESSWRLLPHFPCIRASRRAFSPLELGFFVAVLTVTGTPHSTRRLQCVRLAMSLGVFVAAACGGQEKKPEAKTKPAPTAVESTTFARHAVERHRRRYRGTERDRNRARARHGARSQRGNRTDRSTAAARRFDRQRDDVSGDVSNDVRRGVAREACVDGHRTCRREAQRQRATCRVRAGGAAIVAGKSGRPLSAARPVGTSDAVVTGFGQWNGRIVAKLNVPPNVDSLAREKVVLVALAVHEDSAVVRGDTSTARTDSSRPCTRTARRRIRTVPLWRQSTVRAYRQPPDSTMLARAAAVRDSLMLILQGDTARLPPTSSRGAS